ncbi:energy transducer TonB [Qipengyuania atrilutea]|uniref:Energy transducer TonB n=1 Tax=Qipengyuania atrilutea TaxID=2744473 RepID=A0A850H591_9SPHN|nr:energy transducer TonB [Actirhodobacter atriluteus]NVD45023.1 energy transducer TonB [Actirhodobacter atriluteus]
MVLHKLLSLCAAASLTIATSATAEREVETLDATSPWHLDMAEHKCRLARAFGNEDTPTIFYLEQWGPSERAIWAVAGPQTATFRADRAATYSFGPNGETSEFKFFDSAFGSFGKLLSAHTAIAGKAVIDPDAIEVDAIVVDDRGGSAPGMPQLDGEAAAGVSRLTISQHGRSDLVLSLGNMDKPVKALNACIEDLVKYWGFDPEEQRRVASPPEITNFRTVYREVTKTYPKDAIAEGRQADFYLRLNIDSTGKVSDCVLLNQTVTDGFEMAVDPCSTFMKSAKIKPALDVDGRPVRTFFTTRIVYRRS